MVFSRVGRIASGHGETNGSKFDGPRLTNLLPITNAKVHLHPQRYN